MMFEASRFRFASMSGRIRSTDFALCWFPALGSHPRGNLSGHSIQSAGRTLFTFQTCDLSKLGVSLETGGEWQ